MKRHSLQSGLDKVMSASPPIHSLPLSTLLKHVVPDPLGLPPRESQFLVEQTGCSRETAIQALRYFDHDLVACIAVLRDGYVPCSADP